jgi:hypothetical protein
MSQGTSFFYINMDPVMLLSTLDQGFSVVWQKIFSPEHAHSIKNLKFSQEFKQSLNETPRRIRRMNN